VRGGPPAQGAALQGPDGAGLTVRAWHSRQSTACASGTGAMAQPPSFMLSLYDCMLAVHGVPQPVLQSLLSLVASALREEDSDMSIDSVTRCGGWHTLRMQHGAMRACEHGVQCWGGTLPNAVQRVCADRLLAPPPPPQGTV